MIVASGNVDVAKIIESAVLMAKDENSLHELNEKKGLGSCLHPDGWGAAYLNKKGKFIVKKSTAAIFEDAEVKKLYPLATNFLIVHVRKKAGSEISLKNTHPFKTKHSLLGECVFCHNGHIEDDITFDAKYKPRGKTDSERLFYSILSDITEKSDDKIAATIQKNLQKYTKTQGTNVILAAKEITYVAAGKNQAPRYYGLALGQGKNVMLISSEKLKTFDDISWKYILPGEVIIIHNGAAQFSISKERVPLLQK